MTAQPPRSRVLWRPDTCMCAVVYEWETAAADPMIEPVEITLCESHAALEGSSLQDQFEAIIATCRAASREP